MPWRETRDPYAIWVSETMLQQTRVETVVPYYRRFLREFPDVHALAEAPEERVLSLWSGLGYYRRARMLHAAARQVAGELGGRLPRQAAALRELEGVGAYTAGAVASIAFGERAAVVDGNVTRVLARIHAVEADVTTAAGRGEIGRLAEGHVAGVDGDPGDWNQALMELGATVCTPREPACDRCPAALHCAARARGIAGELPRARAKKPPRLHRRVALVLASTTHVLLARRRVDVLFGGLWEPPSADGDDARPLAVRLGVGRAELTPCGEVTHVLSHRRLQVSVLRAPLPVARGRRARAWPLPGPEYDAIRPVAFDALPQLAHATFARKVLAAAMPRALLALPGDAL
jgi:A/G-specific adenine glycosylase